MAFCYWPDGNLLTRVQVSLADLKLLGIKFLASLNGQAPRLGGEGIFELKCIDLAGRRGNFCLARAGPYSYGWSPDVCLRLGMVTKCVVLYL